MRNLFLTIALSFASAALAVPPQRVEIGYEIARDGSVLAEVSQRLEHDGRSYRLTEVWKGKGMLSLRGEGRVAILERPARQAEDPDQRGDGERVRRGAACGGLERALAAQDREHGLGDEGALLLPEIAMGAEIGRQRLVGGARKRQQFRERRFRVREQGSCRPHSAALRGFTAPRFSWPAGRGACRPCR